MAKEWAKAFYNSAAWIQCREAYIVSVYGLCERCQQPGIILHHKILLTPNNIDDPNTTLNWDYLEYVCRVCHNAEHCKKHNDITQEGLAFDANGQLVEHKTVTIVWGAPAAGKTTYVKTHKGLYDIVVDLDYIMSALSLSNDRSRSSDTFPFAIDIVRLMHNKIADRAYPFKHAWVITTMPFRAKREAMIRDMNANEVHIDTDIQVCIRRAMDDVERQNKDLQIKIINKYFNELEL